MKLRNKKTGETGDYVFESIFDRIDLYSRVAYSETEGMWRYNSLAELNAEWEDYEEPKEYWFIAGRGAVEHALDVGDENDPFDKGHKEMGNYFETKEEAEKAVERLRAWKRLKDKGFRFERWLLGGEYGNTITFSDYIESDDETRADLELLFGGEE